MSKFNSENIDFLDSDVRVKRIQPKQIIRFMNVIKDDSVMDFGAGTGLLTFPLAETVSEGKVYAVDIQREMIEKIQEKNKKLNFKNIITKISQDKKIPISNGEIDKIFMLNVLHEIDNLETLREIRRVIKDKGEIFVLDWRKDTNSIRKGPPKDERLSKTQAVNLLEKYGFSISSSGIKGIYFWIRGKRG